MPSANRFLASLSSNTLDALLLRSNTVVLLSRMICYRAEQRPHSVYFPLSGMVSIVTSMQDGSSVEVGIVGKEGVVGALHLIGPTQVSTHAFVQLPGYAVRISFAEMLHAFNTSAEIRDRVLEYIQEQSVSTSQIAGCNRLHEAEERLARWLLMAQDRTDSADLPFTQEFLAMMLGARRTTVTLVAGLLQEAGLIEYSRGRVTILNRPGLEAAACDCYPIFRQLAANLYRSSVVLSDAPGPQPLRENGAPTPKPLRTLPAGSI